MKQLKPTDDERDPGDVPLREFAIHLPDLTATTEFRTIADHCRMVGSSIVASQFEELKAFDAVDALVDLFQRGLLPLGKRAAGTRLCDYRRDAPYRMSAVERRNFYAMTLGLPAGQPGVAVNRDFQDLWLRFVSSVSSLVRESAVDRSADLAALGQRQVKTAARELAVNISAHGYGMAFYVAADLHKQVTDMIAILSDTEVQAAYGARDMWGVVDTIAQAELGGARNSSRYRMLATSGAIIANWIASHTNRLRATRAIIDLAEVERPPRRRSGRSTASDPTDYDLVNACEQWLAVTGIEAGGDGSVCEEPRPTGSDLEARGS